MAASRISPAATFGPAPATGIQLHPSRVLLKLCSWPRARSPEPPGGSRPGVVKLTLHAKALRQPLRRRAAKVEPEIEVLEVEPEEQRSHFGIAVLASGHRAGRRVGFDHCRPAAIRSSCVARPSSTGLRSPTGGATDTGTWLVLMLVANSSSGTGCPSIWYTFRRCRRKSSSNSRSWSDEWSSPYHQNQSLPSAIEQLLERLLPVRGVRSRRDASEHLPASRSCRQPRRSSPWPIQMKKLPSIHEPGKMRVQRARWGARRPRSS